MTIQAEKHKRFVDVVGMMSRNVVEVVMSAAMAVLNMVMSAAMAIYFDFVPQSAGLGCGIVLLTCAAACLADSLRTFRARRDDTWHAAAEPMKVSYGDSTIISPSIVSANH